MEGDWVSEAQLRHPCRYVHILSPPYIIPHQLRSHAIPSTKKTGKTGEGGGRRRTVRPAAPARLRATLSRALRTFPTPLSPMSSSLYTCAAPDMAPPSAALRGGAEGRGQGWRSYPNAARPHM